MIITQDYFYNKRVSVRQHKKGYRFSVDAPLLADFLPCLETETALEIGTAGGIISLLALYKNKFAKIHGLELQDALFELAKANGEANRFGDRFLPVNGDFNQVYQRFSGITQVFSNPPYYPVTLGRLSPNPEIRDAKFETTLTLEQLLENTFRLLGPNGNLYLVLPYDRADYVSTRAREIGFCIAKTRKIFSFKDGKAERFLVQLTNYDVSPKEMNPLIIFESKGVYTEEMDRILTGQG
ncbi:MAG: hypothetical protein GY765_12220 [bacterium]|nr:hypothetical protein [bacterium]